MDIIIGLIYTIVVSLVISYLTKPKPQNAEPQNPSGAPTIADDQIMPVLFGCRELTNNNVVWWGDNYTTPIYATGGKK